MQRLSPIQVCMHMPHVFGQSLLLHRQHTSQRQDARTKNLISTNFVTSKALSTLCLRLTGTPSLDLLAVAGLRLPAAPAACHPGACCRYPWAWQQQLMVKNYGNAEGQRVAVQRASSPPTMRLQQ